MQSQHGIYGAPGMYDMTGYPAYSGQMYASMGLNASAASANTGIIGNQSGHGNPYSVESAGQFPVLPGMYPSFPTHSYYPNYYPNYPNLNGPDQCASIYPAGPNLRAGLTGLAGPGGIDSNTPLCASTPGPNSGSSTGSGQNLSGTLGPGLVQGPFQNLPASALSVM